MRVTDTLPLTGHRVGLTPVHTATYGSRSSPGVKYTVERYGDGTWHCNCPGNHHHGHCWHVDFERTHYEERKRLPLSALL